MTPFHRSIKDANYLSFGISAIDATIELTSCGHVVLTVEQSKLLRATLEAAERAVPAAISPDDVPQLDGGYPTVEFRDRDRDRVELRKSHVGERCLSMKLVGSNVRIFTPEQVRELRRIIKPFEA